jgi:hypothetical protein
MLASYYGILSSPWKLGSVLTSFDEENKKTTKNATSRFHSNQLILNGEYFKTQIKHGKNSNQSKQHVAVVNLMFEVTSRNIPECLDRAIQSRKP